MKLVCIGDSITWGAWDEDGGWVARMRRRIDRLCIESDLKKFVLTYNYGISSDTTRQVIRRLPATVDALSTVDDEFAFIISLGTNDSAWFNSKQQFWVPLPEYESNLEKIVNLVSEHASKILLLGSLPVDETKTHPYRGQPDIESSNKDIGVYEATMRSVATRKSTQFVPLFELVGQSSLNTFLFDDGVHPNGHGHQLIADAVWPVVVEWINS